ncbi:MAG: hypothetical protein L0H23_05425 [Luteimonas sp.]|nr:hypothetical protein [Luteimonas sp.]
MGTLLGVALPVAAVVAVAFGTLAFFADAAFLLVVVQALLVVGALACAAFVVATVIVDAVARQGTADHARGVAAAALLLLAPARFAYLADLAFTRLLFARLLCARIAQAVGLFTALRLFATLGKSMVRVLVVATRLLSLGLLSLRLFPLGLRAPGLLSLGLVPGFGLPAALFTGAAFGLLLAGGLLAPVCVGA